MDSLTGKKRKEKPNLDLKKTKKKVGKIVAELKKGLKKRSERKKKKKARKISYNPYD